MQAKQSWLGDQAFGADVEAPAIVNYKSHQDALRFMQSTLRDDRGIGLLQGPKMSGKTTMLKRLAADMPRDTAVAYIDGARIKPRELLSNMLAQYGYKTGLESHEELTKMMRVFALQQMRSSQPIVLLVDNADRMYPSSLRVINALAEVTSQDRNAIRIIASGGEGLSAIIDSTGMVRFSERLAGDFLISPLSLGEALLYVHARLEAFGVSNGDTIFPLDVCDRLYQQSGGWPGLMNQYAREAIARATDLPLTVADTYDQKPGGRKAAAELPVLGTDVATGPLPPKLLITRDGDTLADRALTSKKVLIGRSDFADIIIEDDFVSKLHAILILYSDALVLLDLNSANGTTVNSVRVRSTILKDNDIISLGHHRLKVQNAPPISEEMEKALAANDTVKMKNLIDIQRIKAPKDSLTISTVEK